MKRIFFLLALALTTLFTPVTASALYMPPGSGGGGYRYFGPNNFSPYPAYTASRCLSLGTVNGLDSSTKLWLTTSYGMQVSYGSRGGCVQDIQHYLNAIFCTSNTQLSEDGIYGTKTKTAVTRLQQAARSYGLKQVTSASGEALRTADISVDGIYGKQSYLAAMYIHVLRQYGWQFGRSIPYTNCY